MKKTIKIALPLTLFIFFPFINVNGLKAENNNMKFGNIILNNSGSPILKIKETGNIIVRNIIRK